MYNECCGDNRFAIIERAKQDLINSTNIETSPCEMSVLDNILFRCWQMGWLDKYDYEKKVAHRIAKEMLDTLIYENGCEPNEKYKDSLLALSASLEQSIFQLGEGFFTKEMIDNFVDGDEEEIKIIINEHPVLRYPNEILNDIFENRL